MTEQVKFPTDFVWGAATAAYQIEGAINEDGRGESIWDRFCATPGKIMDGSSGAVACDHYHRWPQDIELMQKLGLQAYRFSISWPRIFPQGTGALNEKGLDFYEKLVDSLLAAGIKPYATLYHWDLPQVLEDKGGWTNRETAYAFAAYTEAVVKRLGDRVQGWITLNEPWCSAFLGYRTGDHAPGHTNPQASLKAVHHLLLAHGLAMSHLRRYAPNAEAGITLNLWPMYPAQSDNAADLQAGQRADAENNRVFLDPLFYGRYPQDYLQNLAPDTMPIEAGDLEIIAAPLDFLGVNYYHRHVVQAAPHLPEGYKFIKPKGIYTTMGWEVYPEGLYHLFMRLHTDYQPRRIYITENGASGEDTPDTNGQVQDKLRGYYLQEHLLQMHRAIEAGVPIGGYFVWSLMDNFEWAWGYTRRFGVTYVDYTTQARIVKTSGKWYSQVTKENTVPKDTWRAENFD